VPTANLFLVTQTLQRLLDLNVRALLFRDGLPTNLNVTAMPPERVGAATRTLNLHLYHLMEDAYYKNAEPPGRGGVPVARQPLTLLLYYVMTAHHEVNDVFDAEVQQQLMGLAMKSFHDHPLIADDLAISPNAGPPEAVMAPGLAGRGNHIEVSLRPLTPEEALSFWSAEQTSTARLAAYYEARTLFLEPEPPGEVSGVVVDLDLFVTAGRAPVLERTRALNHLVPPVTAGLGPRTLETSPARATLAPGFVPEVNRVHVEGSALTGDARPGSAVLVLRTPAWARLNPPVASAPVDPDLNPAWDVEIGATHAQFDLQGQLDVDDGSGGTVTLEVTPGIYAVSVRTERRAETASGAQRVTAAESNQLAFSVGARIDGFDPPPGPNQRMALRLVDEFDLTGPDLEVQLAIDGLVYLETNAFANDPGPDQGLFQRQAGGVIELHPLFDATVAGVHPVRLLVNGAESQPFWIELP